MIKCLILKNGVNVISEIIENEDVEVGEPNCRLINPYEINENGQLNRWPFFTDQRSLMISSESILTIVDPSKIIEEQYRELNL
tara:strand:+ start:647 stop:895 length:249 start_codon:yes stop_codon:yes gene_type:complete